MPLRGLKRRGKLIATGVLVLAGAGWVLPGQRDHWPYLLSRRTAGLVEQALRADSRSEASEAVRQIGVRAVPLIVRKGLHDACHRLPFLSFDHLLALGSRHPRLNRWLGIDDFADNCASRHSQAARLLSMMGTNAQAAVPDLIDCLEHCPQLHYVDTTELLDTLGEVSGASRTAIPFLTHYARDYLSLRAAVVAYFIDGQTNLLVETCQRLAQQNPLHLLRTHELYWLREDHLLNQHLVPLFERLHSDPRCGADERRSVLFELECRGGDAEEALNRLRDRQPESSGARDSGVAQIRNPRSEGGVGTARPGTVDTA